MTNTDLVKRLLDEDVLPYLSPEQVIDLCSDAASAIIGLGSANKALTALIAAAPDIARAYLTAKEGWDGATKVGIEYQETIARLTAERDRLRKMVKDAYNAGFSEGMREYTSANGGTPWHDSKFRAALGKEG